jgi:arylsulfatase
LTGYYPHAVNRDKLPGRKGGGAGGKRQQWARLLPDFLKPHGYRNYHSGKWHIDGKCLEAGFDRSLNMRNQGNFFSNAGNQIDDKPVKEVAKDSGYYATTATVDHAIDCLKEHSTDHADKPFFHYVAFIAPHFPLHAPAADIKKYADKYLTGWQEVREKRFAAQLKMGLHKTTLSNLEPDVGPPYDFPEALEKLGPGEVNRPLPWRNLTDEQRRFQATKMAIHAAMIDRMDQEVGRLIEQLKAMDQFENTIIFFGSDNGASAEIMVRNGGHDPKAAPGSAASYLCLGPGFSSACNTPFRRHKTWVHEGGITGLKAFRPKENFVTLRRIWSMCCQRSSKSQALKNRILGKVNRFPLHQEKVWSLHSRGMSRLIANTCGGSMRRTARFALVTSNLFLPKAIRGHFMT